MTVRNESGKHLSYNVRRNKNNCSKTWRVKLGGSEQPVKIMGLRLASDGNLKIKRKRKTKK